MKAKTIVAILISVILAMSSAACGGGSTPGELDVEWSRAFGGPEFDSANSVQQTSDSGFIIAGLTQSFGAGERDVYLIKTDAAGNEQWARTFGGSKPDQGYSVQQTSDGGFIVAGETFSFGAGSWDVYLIKTDAAGNEQWAKTFGGPSVDSGRSVQQTSDGGFIIAGLTQSFGAGERDVYLIKTDAAGNEQWARTFGGPESDYGWSVQQTSDDGFIIAGETGSIVGRGGNAYLIKTDSAGNEQWAKTFGESDLARAFSVRQTPDDGFLIGGYTVPSGVIIIEPEAYEPDVYLIKTDAAGNEQWNKVFSGSGLSTSAQQTPDDGFIVGWFYEPYDDGERDVYLIMTDATGNEIWTEVFSSSNACESIQQTSDVGFIIAGLTLSLGAGERDVWLMKLAPED